MKKSLGFLFILIICIVFSLSGCSNLIEHDYDIRNSSSYTVTFSIRNYGSDEHVLASGESVRLTTYESPDLLFTGNPRVRYGWCGDYTLISDLAYYSYTVFNASQSSITVSESHGMLTGTYASTVVIAAGDTVTVKVYTSRPCFTAVYTSSLTPADCTADGHSVTVK